MFNLYASGVRANAGEPWIARTPLALRLNVSSCPEAIKPPRASRLSLEVDPVVSQLNLFQRHVLVKAV